MYLTSIWRILLMTDGLNAVWSNDRAAHTDTNPKNLHYSHEPLGWEPMVMLYTYIKLRNFPLSRCPDRSQEEQGPPRSAEWADPVPSTSGLSRRGKEGDNRTRVASPYSDVIANGSVGGRGENCGRVEKSTTMERSTRRHNDTETVIDYQKK